MRCGHTGGRAIGLQAAVVAAAAETAVVALHDHMAQLAGKTVMAVHKLAVDYHARAYACAECDHYEILQTAGSTVGHLADSGGIGVVGNRHRHAELVADKFSQGYGGGPGKIDTRLDHA